MSSSFSQMVLDTLHNWELNVNKEKIQVKVPSEYHLDLYQANKSSHPYSWNDTTIEQNIESQEYVYTTTFFGKDYINQDHLELVFEGLDTYAEVKLNGAIILNANNMFRSWEVDIKEKILVGSNTLEVRIINPVNYHKESIVNEPYSLPSGNETVPIKVANHTRKACYQFGWDWAERFVGGGIWRPVYLRSWNSYRVSDFYVETIQASEKEAKIKYQIEVSSNSNEKINLKFDENVIKKNLKKGVNKFCFEKTIKNPQLWFPNGYGDPILHEAKAEIYVNRELLIENKCTYGIREIELVNQLDSIGTSFYFMVNGKKIFAKGANYVPMSSFPSEVNKDDYRKIISQVKNANMNMLRVWGGGIYENDEFYKQCDRNGILIWQDFMFANSLYPSDKDFLENIFQEIEENVKRLRIHPCIALWCGNNEIEVAWNNWGWQNSFGWSEQDSIDIWENYKTIFQVEFPNIVQRLTPNISYVSTSPLSNWGTEENFNHSSMHYWGVWHGKDDFSDFKNNVGRFMVEYGFQSYPSHHLLSAYSETKKLDSIDIKKRQKSYVGDKWISNEIEKRYGKVNDFKKWLELSQHIQAIALKEAIQSHRLSPKCMGTLFWQLNDCWVGPSWSVLNYDHTEKTGYAEVKKLYSPQLIVIDTTNQTLLIRGVSDEIQPVNVLLDIEIKNKGVTIFNDKIENTLNFLETKEFLKFQFSEIGLNDDSFIISIKLREKKSNNLLFQETFYSGLTPEEESILRNN